MAVISRDRLPRPVDISTLFRGAARNVSLVVAGNVAGDDVGQGNRRPGRRGGGWRNGSVLPRWYQRTPFRDITGIVRAIEGRRAELQAAQPTESPPKNTPSVSGVHPQQQNPVPTILMKPGSSSPTTQARKSMTRVTLNENHETGDFLTPEKKLLNSIDQVSERWVIEQGKLERTPAAKKAERDRKFRTLMTMR